MRASLLDVITRAGAPAVADDVSFHSPAADYRGRADVLHLLELIGTVLDDVTETRRFVDQDATTTFLTARVGDEALSGVLDKHRDASGAIVEATLLLRPYAALGSAMRLMQERLADDPLPSARA